MNATLMIFGIAALSALCIAAIGFVFTGKDDKTAKRMARMAGAERKVHRGESAEVDNSDKRRKQVQETLKSIELKQSEQKKVDLRTRIERAGLVITPRNFH